METGKIPQEGSIAQTHLEDEPIHKGLLNQKGNFLFILAAIVIILVVLGVWGYFLYSNNADQKQPSAESSAQPVSVLENQKNSGTIEKDEKTGEQIYKNNLLNYSIKVPKDWVIYDDPSVFIGIPGNAILSPGQNPNSHSPFSLAIFAAKDKVGLRLSYGGDFKQALNEKSSLGKGEQTFKLGNVKIAGLDATQFVHRTLPGDATETFYSVITWMVYKDTNYYFEFYGDEEIVKNNLSLYNNILSTFKILDENIVDTSNWKTYTNTKYDYSIKYPDTWIVNEDDSNGINIVGMGKRSKGGFTYGGQSVLIRVSQVSSPTEDNMDDYIKDNIAPNSNSKRLGYANINNYSGPKWSFNNNNEDDNYAIFFNIAGNQYVLIKELSNISQYKEYNSEIDQVISTFKLTR